MRLACDIYSGTVGAPSHRRPSFYHLCIEFVVSSYLKKPVFSPFNSFVSFIFHLFFILFIFYSRSSRRAAVSLRSFIDPLPTASILHQLFSSFFPPVVAVFHSRLSVMFLCSILTFIASRTHSGLLFCHLFSSFFHVFFSDAGDSIAFCCRWSRGFCSDSFASIPALL